VNVTREVPGEELPKAGLPPPLRRALLLSIPAAALASLPFALELRDSLPRSLVSLGLPVSTAPRWACIAGFILLCVLVAAASFEAVRVLVLEVRSPFPRYSLLLFNIAALMFSLGALVVTVSTFIFPVYQP
jgi:hypothetical protein